MHGISKSFVIDELTKSQNKTLNSAILLGSANLPYHRLNDINNYILDYNAAEGNRNFRLFPGCTELNNIEKYGEYLFNNLFNTHKKYNVIFDPLSGTQANQIVYNAVLTRGDIVLALSEKAGGHPSHIDYLKRYFKVYEYGYCISQKDIDYIYIEKLCERYHPKMIIAGASSFPLEIKYDILSNICKKYDCLLLADISHTVLYIQCKKHVSPFDYADFITFTTHKTTRGPRGAILAYKSSYQKEIEYSVFPLSQGAPIFSQICSKVLMLEEMIKDNLTEYCEQILKLSNNFLTKINAAGIPIWTSKTNSHICVIDTQYTYANSQILQNIYEYNNIYVTSCWLPHNFSTMTGLRFGFMMLATLKISESDFSHLTDIIIDIYNNPKQNFGNEVSNIITPYFFKYFNKEI